MQKYIDNCITCLTANSSANQFEGEIFLTTLPKVLMEVIHVDHFSPLQQTENNYKIYWL